MDASGDDYGLGRLGSGLSGARITPLHAAQLAATLSEGRRTSPHWISAVRDAEGRHLLLPRPPGEIVMTLEDVRKSYGDKPVYRGLGFQLRRGG